MTTIILIIASSLLGIGWAHLCLYAIKEELHFNFKYHLKSTIPFLIGLGTIIYVFKYML